MKAENHNNRGCPQRDSAEHEGYAEVRRYFARYGKKRTVYSQNSWRR